MHEEEPKEQDIFIQPRLNTRWPCRKRLSVVQPSPPKLMEKHCVKIDENQPLRLNNNSSPRLVQKSM